MRNLRSAFPLLLLPAVAVVLLGAAPAQESDTKPFLQFLFAAYSITWAAFFGYSFFMSRKQRELKRELEALRQRLDERDGTPPAAE
jgi:CcmD family protein